MRLALVSKPGPCAVVILAVYQLKPTPLQMELELGATSELCTSTKRVSALTEHATISGFVCTYIVASPQPRTSLAASTTVEECAVAKMVFVIASLTFPFAATVFVRAVHLKRRQFHLHEAFTTSHTFIVDKRSTSTLWTVPTLCSTVFAEKNSTTRCHDRSVQRLHTNQCTGEGMIDRFLVHIHVWKCETLIQCIQRQVCHWYQLQMV
mmetsp:Transcript_53409/g.134154  ORF Transcript_53409/g.134154 Transcript_53409/m.134154 type:complete len:208 (+) Transcript_53409:1103-1726(+)